MHVYTDVSIETLQNVNIINHLFGLWGQFSSSGSAHAIVHRLNVYRVDVLKPTLLWIIDVCLKETKGKISHIVFHVHAYQRHCKASDPTNLLCAKWNHDIWDLLQICQWQTKCAYLFCCCITVEFDNWLWPENDYRQVSNIRRTLVGNKIVDHSDVVGASPVGAAPTTSSFSTKHLASLDWAKTAARRDEKQLSLGIWCDLY